MKDEVRLAELKSEVAQGQAEIERRRRELARLDVRIRRCLLAMKLGAVLAVLSAWWLVQAVGYSLPLALVALSVFGLAGVHVYRERFTFQRGLRFRGSPLELSSGDAVRPLRSEGYRPAKSKTRRTPPMGTRGVPPKFAARVSDGSMTPEQIIANGWGPLDVALILVSQGFKIERAQNPHMLCVVAVRYGARLGHARDLWSPQTTTRKREAKHLSEALGGRYSFHSDDAPSDWPDDWDFDRHDLIAWLDASEDS